jgi:ferredoxin-like protein FixX
MAERTRKVEADMQTSNYTKIDASPDGSVVHLAQRGVWTQLITAVQPCSIITPSQVFNKRTPVLNFDSLNCVEVHVGAESFIAVGPAQ